MGAKGKPVASGEGHTGNQTGQQAQQELQGRLYKAAKKVRQVERDINSGKVGICDLLAAQAELDKAIKEYERGQ